MILGENAENSGRDLMRLLKSHLKYTQKFKMTLYKIQRIYNCVCFALRAKLCHECIVSILLSRTNINNH